MVYKITESQKEELRDKINVTKQVAAKEAVEEYRDKLVNIIKEWYWDDELQSYHPDCDLFVNKFIVTVKEEADKMFKD